jgi:hypothetical protein
MLLIYTDKITHRTNYIFRLFFGQLLGISFEITADREAFLSHEGPAISYSKTPLGSELFFSANGLLFQRGIEGQEISFLKYADTVAFFPSMHKDSALPFDPFSAAFYLVSRYEEYLPYKLDEYGRFRATDSFSYQKGFLNKPVINSWANAILGKLKECYPGISMKKRKYRFIPTIDIDSAWQFREKGLLRTVGGYLRSLFSAEFMDIRDRTSVLLHVENDPFDTYNEQIKILAEYQLKPIYFVLFGNYGMNDKNIHVNNLAFQVLVKSLADHAEIGLHASFSSSYKPASLENELNGLSNVLHRDVYCSRQHYLRLNLPYMYRALADLNIREDYSMGYNTFHGFRAGIADPFYFYDLDQDLPTRVKVFPFAFSINKFWRPDNAEKLDYIRQIIQEVRQVDGTLVGAWDNQALSQYKISDWEGGFREILDMAVG